IEREGWLRASHAVSQFDAAVVIRSFGCSLVHFGKCAAHLGFRLATPHQSPVEACLESLVVCFFPLFYGDAVFLLDSVSVPFRDDVECAEGNDSQVWGQVMDVASLEALKVLVVLVLEVHHAEE